MNGNNLLIKSPLNYVGGKYSILNELVKEFPKDIDIFVDAFAGGYNVGINIDAKRHIVNDINSHVIEIIETIYNMDIDNIYEHIDNNIKLYSLSKENVEGYYRLREDYNNNPNPLDLYTLVCFSFNHQIRFNNDFKYNTPFGKNRSSYSKTLKKRLLDFSTKIKTQSIDFFTLPFENIDLSELTSDSFIYCDPPYLITSASYNDGKRGYDGWNEDDEIKLLNYLDKINGLGIKFALSNVIEHKGKTNEILIEWSKKYNTKFIEKNYKNSSYNTTRGESIEVLIMNY